MHTRTTPRTFVCLCRHFIQPVRERVIRGLGFIAGPDNYTTQHAAGKCCCARRGLRPSEDSKCSLNAAEMDGESVRIAGLGANRFCLIWPDCRASGYLAWLSAWSTFLRTMSNNEQVYGRSSTTYPCHAPHIWPSAPLTPLLRKIVTVRAMCGGQICGARHG
jgi:hypothetical protein